MNWNAFINRAIADAGDTGDKHPVTRVSLRQIADSAVEADRAVEIPRAMNIRVLGRAAVRERLELRNQA